MTTMTYTFLNTLSRLSTLGYSLELEPRELCIICRVRDLNGHGGVNKRISYAELSISRLDPGAYIFKVVDDAIDELEATGHNKRGE